MSPQVNILTDRERHREAERRYRERHRDEINSRRRAGYDPLLNRKRSLARKAKNPEHVNKLARAALKRYREKHREELRIKARENYQLNKDKERLRRLKYLEANRDSINAKNRIRDAQPERKVRKAELERTEKRIATRKAYRIANPRSEYHKTHEKIYRERRKQLHEKHQAENPQYRLRKTLRARLKSAIKNNWKVGSAIENLGCSIDELKVHLEQLWQDGMNWENFGRLGSSCCTWQIDHVIPLSSFDLTDQKQVAIACHWTNLAPLWAIDNRRKGNRIVSREGVSNAF